MQGSKKDFVWYELMATDLDAAKQFYSAVVGWKIDQSPMSTMPYLIITARAGCGGVGGMMQLTPDMRSGGAQPAWISYIFADDVDAATDAIRKAGGAARREPSDIPQIGRFSVVADPQGAMFNLFKPVPPTGEMPAPLGPREAGNVGWRELMALDAEKAWEFYASQFGWTKSEAYDMGGFSYQTFSTNDKPDQPMTGGMMTMMPFMLNDVKAAYWQFYFNVPDIQEAKARVEENGGKVIHGPVEVPGGSWTLNAIDPQGAFFGLLQPVA